MKTTEHDNIPQIMTETQQAKEPKDSVTIGHVEAPLPIWRQVSAYKTRERMRGRKLKMRDALLELAEIGAKHEGLK